MDLVMQAIEHWRNGRFDDALELVRLMTPNEKDLFEKYVGQLPYQN